jgi:ABC-type lipoprotein export system ATPase subunit
MIRLHNISKYYHTANSVGLGLQKISLDFSIGEFVVVTGQSGSGKSTLLNIISGLDTYEDGEMYVFGEETSHFTVDDWEQYRAKNIGYISQNYNIVNSYTVLQNILVTLDLQDYPKEKRKQRALELIEMVGLTDRKNHKAGKLSGGEKQRTVIARALAKDAPIIVCDEPTGNLDSESSKAIISLIEKIKEDKLVVLVTHDFDKVRHIATRSIRLRDGEVIEDHQIKENIVQTNTMETSEEKEHLIHKIPFSTMLKTSIRNLFATPKRLFFMLTLQSIITGIFIFIYAFLYLSSDLLIGELAGDNDSSHRIEIVRRDEQKITDVSEFENNDLVKSVVELEMIFHAYKAIGNVDEESTDGTYPLGEINMNDATVLNEADITAGRLPNANEVVLSELSMQLYDLEIGDEVSLLRAYTKYAKSIGDVYIISGTTLRGNNQSVYFNSAIFEDRELALDGLINSAGKALNYRYIKKEPLNPEPNPPETYDVMPSGKFVFDETLDDWEIKIPTGTVWPDDYNVTVTYLEMSIGSYYGDQYIFEDIDLENVTRFRDSTSNVYLSTTYQEVLLDHYFNDDFEPTKIVLNVSDLTDGKRLAREIDQDTYRLFYYVAAVDSREALLTQEQFSLISYIIIIVVGSLLYTIFGVALRNVYQARKKDFTIFRSIGANRSFLAKQMIVEQLFSTIIAFSIIVIVIQLLSIYNYQVSRTMLHVNGWQYLILFAISVVLSIQVVLKSNRQIFNISVVSSLNESGEAK